MTSIISPWAYATNLATKAQDRLSQASNMLRSDAPRPLDGEQPRTDSDGFIPPHMRNNGAARLAGGAVQAIEQALGLGDSLSSDVRTAFNGALTAAKSGVEMLTADTLTPVDRSAAPLRFDAAGMWLDLAKSLLSLDHGTHSLPAPHPPVVRPPVVRPPVTTMPVAPGEPGSPITIEPIKPITIQLPSPDSPIQ